MLYFESCIGVKVNEYKKYSYNCARSLDAADRRGIELARVGQARARDVDAGDDGGHTVEGVRILEGADEDGHLGNEA